MNLRACSLALAVLMLPLLQGCGGGGGNNNGGTTGTLPGPSINNVIPQWPAGTTWTYQVTGQNPGTRTRTVVATSLTNPNDHQPVLELKDTLVSGSGSQQMTTVLNDFYFRQDTTGTVYFEGAPSAPGSSTSMPVWVMTSSPSAPVIFPSPMNVGQIIGPFNVTSSNGGTTTLLRTSVDPVETVFVPLGTNNALEGILGFRLTTVDTAGGTINATWFDPPIGILKIQSADQNNVVIDTSVLTATTLPH